MLFYLNILLHQKLAVIVGMFALTVVLVSNSGQQAVAAPFSKNSIISEYLDGVSMLQKTHGFHCNRANGHRHKAHCPGHRLCFKKCYRFALHRFNCRNLYSFCLKSKKSRVACRNEYRKCRIRARSFCKRACARR